MSSITNQAENPFLNKCFAQKEKEEIEIIIDFIKKLVTEVYNSSFDFYPNVSLIQVIRTKLPVSLAEAETWFFEQEAKTIEQYTYELRLDKVKELLVYSNFSADVIEQKLNYSSVITMSQELLYQTGLTTTFLLAMKEQKANLVLRQRLNALN